MGVAEVKGIQSQHVMAQIKHYVAYDSNSGNIYVDDQTLHEVYVAPVRRGHQQADVSSIMCSYNRVNGTFACGNESTLTKILRDEIGFKGFVTSDWGAVHAVNFINAGLDMEMPGEPKPDGGGFQIPSFFDLQPAPPPPPAREAAAETETADNMLGGFIPEEPIPPRGDFGDFGIKLDPKKMPEALKDGTVNEAAITRAAGRVLYEIVHFGYLDGQSKHEVTAQSIEANAKIIEKTGEDAAVLLKNEGGALPLKAADLDSVVLIGPTALQVDSIGINGERSVGLPQRQVGPLDALRKISGNTKIKFAVDDDMTGVPVPASALSHDGKPGLERTGSGAANRRATQLHRRKGARPQLQRHLEGHADRAPRRHLLALSAGHGHQRQYSARRQAAGRNRRLPGRRAWRHPASQPGQRHSHHRRPGQCAPRG